MNTNELSYQQLLNLSYDEIVNYLLKKYGPAKYDYFLKDNCKSKNYKVTRTSEGLYCHHIDEDKAIMLSTTEYAIKNPYAYQKADRLVYCNALEHFILHIKIAESPNLHANEHELPGIGGAVNFLCHELDSIYEGKQFNKTWRKKIAEKVQDDLDDYIKALYYLIKVINDNPKYQKGANVELLFIDSDNQVAQRVLTAFNSKQVLSRQLKSLFVSICLELIKNDNQCLVKREKYQKEDIDLLIQKGLLVKKDLSNNDDWCYMVSATLIGRNYLKQILNEVNENAN